MALPSNIPSFQKGSRLLNGTDVQKLADLTGSTQLVAAATPAGNKSTSIQINAAVVEVDAVASANDSIVLPLGYPGLRITIFNHAAANSLRVFAAGSDVVNNAQTQIDLAANKAQDFLCTSKTGAIAQWATILTA